MEKKPDQLPLDLGGKMGKNWRKFFSLPFEAIAFISVLLSYFLGKVLSFIAWVGGLGFFLQRSAVQAKFTFVRKLVWGRGRRFSPVSNLGLLALALTVFVSGSLLSGSKLVRSSSAFVSSDYLSAADVVASYQSPLTEIPSDRPSQEPVEYIVQGGDTLSSIGERHHVSVDAIRYANNLDDEGFLSVGQKITIPPVSGVIYTVKSGDSIEAIAKRYKAAPQAIADFNYIVDNGDLKVGQKIIVPNAEIPPIPVKFTAPPLAYRSQPPRGAVVPLTAYNEPGSSGEVAGATGSFGWPINNRYITQYFYSYHLGIDIPANTGDRVYAADGGRVSRAGWWPGGFGNAVKIDHGNGYSTMYAHLSQIEVSLGQTVSKGGLIGRTGNTGRSFGSHLHFAVQQFGRYLNPLSVF